MFRNPLRAKQAKKNDGETRAVRLLPSALFFNASTPLPRGIRTRDLDALAQGLVEEHSPLPLEQTAWGFLHEKSARGKSLGHLLYYAAPRDLIFPEGAGAELGDPPIMPAFAALSGVSFQQDTWVFLSDSGGVGAALIEAGTTTPRKVIARFSENAGDPATPDEAGLWKLREELAARCREDGKERNAGPAAGILPGLLRAKAFSIKAGRGVRFELEHREKPGHAWQHWQKHELKRPAQLVAADLRDRATLQFRQDGERSSQRILVALAGIAAAVVILLGLEFIQHQRASEARDLQALIRDRQSSVERLQEIEQMTRAVGEIFERDFRPFDWLMIVNESRPPEIYFSSFGFETGQEMIVAGQSSQVSHINTYNERLGRDPRLGGSRLSQVATTREGVNFNLAIRPGDLTAPPPEPVAAAETNGEDEAPPEPAGDEPPPGDEPAPGEIPAP